MLQITQSTRMHFSRMRTARSLPHGGLHDRDPLDRDPPDRNPPDRDPPDRDPWTETSWTETPNPDRDHPAQRPPRDRDPPDGDSQDGDPPSPPGQRPRPSPVNRITDTCKNIIFVAGGKNSHYVSIIGFEIISGFCDPLINHVDHNKNWSLVLLSRQICLELRHQVLRILFYNQQTQHENRETP